MCKLALIAFLLVTITNHSGTRPDKATREQVPEKKIITYSLVSNRLSLHEPVIINFTINNVLSEAITVDLGRDRKEAFLFTVTQPDGAVTQLPSLMIDGIALIGRITVAPGKSYTQHLLVNEWFEFPVPGRYVIDVRLDNPVRTQKQVTVVNGTRFRAGLDIIPRDAERLKSVCESLFQQTITSKTSSEASESTLALSYIIDPIVVPYLEKILKSNKMVEAVCITGLRRVGGTEAVRVLISALNMRDLEIIAMSRFALDKLEKESTDPALKKQINRAIKK